MTKQKCLKALQDYYHLLHDDIHELDTATLQQCFLSYEMAFTSHTSTCGSTAGEKAEVHLFNAF